MTDVYIGVGSNIDAQQNLTSAIDVLQERMGAVELSCTYRNPPVGFDGDDFLNLVLRLHSDAGPIAVEKILNEIGKMHDSEPSMVVTVRVSMVEQTMEP